MEHVYIEIVSQLQWKASIQQGWQWRGRLQYQTTLRTWNCKVIFPSQFPSTVPRSLFLLIEMDKPEVGNYIPPQPVLHTRKLISLRVELILRGNLANSIKTTLFNHHLNIKQQIDLPVKLFMREIGGFRCCHFVFGCKADCGSFRWYHSTAYP